MSELESSVIIDNPHPDRPQEDIAAISELITGGDTESEPQDAPKAPESDDQQPEMAEQGEIDTAPQEDADELEAPQVDYDLVVPMPDGMESMTVGQLKDHYRETQDLQQEREDWEAQQSEQQLQLMATRNKLVTLAESLQNVPPEIIQQVEQLQQFDAQRESALLLQVFPEWANAEKKAAARDEHLATIREYGYSDIDYAQIQDHRLIKLLHDLTQLRKREAAGKAKREELKAQLPKGQKPVQRKQTPAQERAALINRAKRGSESDKIAAISSLITGD